MFEQYCEYLEQIGISNTDLYLQETDELTTVTFLQEGDDNNGFYVSLAFYHDSNKAEINVLLNSDKSEEPDVLRKINALNIRYCGMTFISVSDALALKLFMEDNYEIEDLLAKVMLAITIAQKELPNI